MNCSRSATAHGRSSDAEHVIHGWPTVKIPAMARISSAEPFSGPEEDKTWTVDHSCLRLVKIHEVLERSVELGDRGDR